MWLLESSVLEHIEKMTRMYTAGAGLVFPRDPSLVRRATPLTVAGKQAVIEVKGVLTKKPDPFMAFLFGANTSYEDINTQLSAAERDQSVESIRLDIDSPGGNTDGLFDTLAAIEGVSKPMTVSARRALSAAYGIAAAAGPITAANKASEFGSVGTVVRIPVFDNVVTVTSSNAPDKMPDPKTEEGKATIVRQLDAIEDLFVGAIASGRSISPDAVRQGYGRGATLMAGEAQSRGMINGIAGTGLRVVQDVNQATAAGGSEAKMDLEQLKAEHPALYKEAVACGVQQERDRVTAHLQLGESGDIKVALEAIKDGSEISQTTFSAHMAFALNKKDVSARNSDQNDVDGATGNVGDPPNQGDSHQAAVLKRLVELRGNGAIENG